MGRCCLIILVLIYALQSTVFAQDNMKSETLNNTAYFEFLGNAYLYSLNYERKIVNTPKFSLSGRIGISTFNIRLSGQGWSTNRSNHNFIPITFNFIRHFDRNNFEMGIGAVNAFTKYGKEEYEYKFIPTLSAGYRRYMGKNLDLRAGLNLSNANLNQDAGFGIFPWPYLSIGKRF
jgi:hypothetical protein